MKSADSWAHADSGEKEEPAAIELCSGCGLPLAQRGSNGECLRCAVGRAGNSSDESLNHPPGTDNPKTEASEVQIHYGRFEVLLGSDGQPEELGSGAMATTYRARDTVLHSLVALKIISREIAGNSIARSRFLREARAAAKLRHPNVGSVFHYGEQDGECYYVMELIQGETLAERVRTKGVFTAKQTLEVGIQVARALAAAESYRLVHRDIKPSNLMLEADPEADADKNDRIHVRIIDWGLAKSISAEDGLFGHDETRDGFIGTPGFASPEQFERPAENRVDTRSDIYSLGVTLWYLLCGRTPLAGDTLEAIHERQKGLPWEQLKSAKVPGRLVEVLHSILAFDPAERPQSARELLDLLRRCQQQLEGVTLQTRRMQRWRWLLAIVLVGLAAAGTGLWWQHRLTHQADGTAAKPSLAVLPFENLNPDPAQAFFSAGMQYEIWNSLAGVAGMKLIGLDSTASYDAGRPRDYAAIGRTLGVKHLLEGSVWRGGQRVTIEIRLVDVDHSDRVWERKAEGALADEFSLQTKLVRDLISQLQASLSPEEDHRLNQPLTNDPVALDLLLQGCMLDKSGKGPSDPIECKLQQISLLNSAVARDPNLVQAYCALAGTHMYLYGIRQSLPSKEQNVDHRGLADIALAQARRLQPDGGEVHFVTAYLVFLSNRDPDQAWVEAELARKALPNDPVTYQLMGLIAYRQGRWREAIQCLEQGCVLDPISWDCRSDLASFYRKLRRYSDHDREMQLVLATWPGNWWYRLYEALGDVDKGDLAPLRKTLAELPPTKYRDGRQPFLCGFTLHLFERDAEAVAETLAKYTVDPIWKYKHLYPRAWYAAQLDRLRGDNAQARKDFAVARVSMEKQVIANPDDGWALSMLALFDAGLGQKDEAIAEGLRAVDLEPYGARPFDEASFIRGNLALVYAWTGGVSQALEVLESITDKPSNYDSPSQPSYGDLLLNPCWDSLRGDPRFKKILEQFQKPVPGS